jgi:iron(III) transport system substrate-binding protein
MTGTRSSFRATGRLGRAVTVALTVAAASTVAATVPSGAATARQGDSCRRDGQQVADLVCRNVAKSGQRPRLAWVRTQTATTSPSASATPAPSTTSVPQKLTVYSGRTYGFESSFTRFTKETGIELEVVTGSDPANRARLSAEGARTPADVYLTVDIASLHRAAEDGLLVPIQSRTLTAAVPNDLRDASNRWFGLTRRARIIYVNSERVSRAEWPSTYEDLASPRWAGRLCSRPSSHVYTQSFAANVMAAYGSSAPQILAGLARNTKSENFIDSDTRMIETVNAGGCDATIANTYYFFRPGLKKTNVAMIFPNQADGQRGVHVNVSGAGVVSASDNKAAAQRFIEWMATSGAEEFAGGNNEFPVNPATKMPAEVAAIATFKADQGRIDDYARMQPAALIVLTESGWR